MPIFGRVRAALRRDKAGSGPDAAAAVDADAARVALADVGPPAPHVVAGVGSDDPNGANDALRNINLDDILIEDDVAAEIDALDAINEERERVRRASLISNVDLPAAHRLVDLILVDAIKKRASDIFVEPYAKEMRVRYRLNGVTHEVMKPPLRLRHAMSMRFRELAHLDPLSLSPAPPTTTSKSKRAKAAELRAAAAHYRTLRDSMERSPASTTSSSATLASLPAVTGAFRLVDDHGTLAHYRLTVQPGPFGETCALRVCASPQPWPLDALGMSEDLQARLWHTMQKPGLIVIASGSSAGRLTTLRTLVKHTTMPDRAVALCMRHLEAETPSTANVLVTGDAVGANVKAVANALALDSDIVFVDDVDPQECAGIVDLARRRKTIVMTLAAHDIADAIGTMIQAGASPDVVADLLRLVVHQRLDPIPCMRCEGVPYDPAFECEECQNRKVVGRIACFDAVVPDSNLRWLLTEKPNRGELRDAIAEIIPPAATSSSTATTA